MDNKERVITVTKTAEEKFAADTVVVSIDAKASESKYSTAVDKTDRLSVTTIAIANNAGFKPRLIGVNVSTVRKDGKITAYNAVRSFEIEFAYDHVKLDTLFGILSDSACEWRVTFMLKDRSHADELIARAVEEAKHAAETIARAAGVKLGALVNAEYASHGGARPMMCRAAYADGNGNAEPAHVEMSETVVCSWRVE